MIYEHEIPSQSRLYFGKSAKLKRNIEHIASGVLFEKAYEEIVTPVFSYHQHLTIPEQDLVRFSDRQNNIISLRADSSLDIVRIITKRLGRSVAQQKWFYIQSVFKYPTIEINQIGSEWIQNDKILFSIQDSLEVLNALNLKPLLQISNMKIPEIICKELDLEIEIFKSGNLQDLLRLDINWLSKLTYVQNISQIDSILDSVPLVLKDELLKLRDICKEIDYGQKVVAPLYYAKMQYYDNLFFRFIQGNETLGMGGHYNHEDIDVTGFALYTDKLIEEMSR
jgi:histidyl-tRNA synthetase